MSLSRYLPTTLSQLLRRSITLCLWSCSLSAMPVIAEDTSSTTTGASAVTVLVRTIQASDSSETPEHSSSPSSTSELSIEEAIVDLKPKLSQLPFRSFKLLSSKQQQLQIKRKQTLILPNGQSVSFRPTSSKDKRVSMLLHWRDADGSEILNTSIHFDSDDSLVTGTDCSDNEGLILAIKATPILP